MFTPAQKPRGAARRRFIGSQKSGVRGQGKIEDAQVLSVTPLSYPVAAQCLAAGVMILPPMVLPEPLILRRVNRLSPRLPQGYDAHQSKRRDKQADDQDDFRLERRKAEPLNFPGGQDDPAERENDADENGGGNLIEKGKGGFHSAGTPD